MKSKGSDGSRNGEDPTRTYEIGYRRPPVATRFKPGQSGNPKGRPKGKRNLRTELEEALQEQVVIRTGNRTRKVTKQNALITSLVHKALNGDAKAMNSLFGLSRSVGLTAEPPESTPSGPLTAEDAAILEDFLRRNVPDTAPKGDGGNGGQS